MLQEATVNTLGKNVKIESLSKETQTIKRSQTVILEFKNAIVSELEHRLIEIIQPNKKRRGEGGRRVKKVPGRTLRDL